MKLTHTKVAQLLLIVALITPWTAIEALEEFHRAGIIGKISYDSFYVNNKKYRIAPGGKIKILNQNNVKLSNLKVGDNVSFRGKTLSGVNYVDIVVYHVIDNE